MFVILTSKPGAFVTEITEGLKPVEAYDYIFGDTRKARFVIAALDAPLRVRIVDEAAPRATNLIPSKLLETFETVEDARAELEGLVVFRSVHARLAPVDLAAGA